VIFGFDPPLFLIDINSNYKNYNKMQ